MPSFFESCGLAQMIGAIYGALPIAHDTGGIHDTIFHLDAAKNSGNGFLFKTFNAGGLNWAMDQAMQFYMMPLNKKERQVNRIMRQSALTFNYQVTAQKYIVLYENLLRRPLINPLSMKSQTAMVNHPKEILVLQKNPDFTISDTELHTKKRMKG
jgi:starch synthase/alpha-amylase